jgi:hypothetical protein
MEFIAGIDYWWVRNQPSSAVQQSAYLEALDQYIDYDEHGNIRKCLLDSKGNRLILSKNCLYELFEALLCCCASAKAV